MLYTRFAYDGAIECGTDEVGRGCLAGPVVAAAVILPDGFSDERINDSKQLSKTDRLELTPIIQNAALSYSIVEVSPQKIDEINIREASVLAMHMAIAKLQMRPERILSDGNYFPPYPLPDVAASLSNKETIPHHTIIGGDGKYLSIAAASILAKTYRDTLMTQLAADFPGYGWERNMGYPTPSHRAAIELFGITPWHRLSFRLTTIG